MHTNLAQWITYEDNILEENVSKPADEILADSAATHQKFLRHYNQFYNKIHRLGLQAKQSSGTEQMIMQENAITSRHVAHDDMNRKRETLEKLIKGVRENTLTSLSLVQQRQTDQKDRVQSLIDSTAEMERQTGLGLKQAASGALSDADGNEEERRSYPASVSKILGLAEDTITKMDFKEMLLSNKSSILKLINEKDGSVDDEVRNLTDKLHGQMETDRA